MDNSDLCLYWERYVLQDDNIAQRLTEFFSHFFLEKDGGVVFMTTELGRSYFKDEKVTLKIEDGTKCFFKRFDTGNNSLDWEYVGVIYEDPLPPSYGNSEYDRE